MTALQELDRYLGEMGRQGSLDATIQNNRGYCSSYLEFCRAADNQFELADVKPETVKQFAVSLWDKPSTDSTFRSIVGGVLKWCRWLEAEEKIASETSFKELRASGMLAELKRVRPLRSRT